MRLVHLFIAGLSLISLLFCELYDSQAYTYVGDQSHTVKTQIEEVNHLRLTGWDFILGRMPKELAGEGFSLPHYRWGAIGCAVILLLLAAVSVWVKQTRRLVWTNFVLLGLFFIAYIQLDNFKNPYFEFIAENQLPGTSTTIDTQMLIATKLIVVAMEILALINFLYLLVLPAKKNSPRSSSVAEAIW